MTTRRSILALLALTPIASNLTACSPPIDAASAWRNPGASEKDVRRFALAHAILAPNPHNRQPWLARLVGSDTVELSFDLKKLLPATDPFSRQITVGAGAFLELLSIAASRMGKSAKITPFPEGDDAERLDQRPFAQVIFSDGAKTDPLFDAILKRRTNRTPFDTSRPVSVALASKLAAAGTFGQANGEVIADARVPKLRELTDSAWRVEVKTPAAWQESIDLMRIGNAEIAAHRDGLALEGPMIDALKLTGLLTPEQFAKKGSIAFEQSLTQIHPAAETAMAYLAVTTPTNNRSAQINAGRAYVRANLTATTLGLAIHPLSQALQEYPEMAAAKAKMDAITNAPANGRLQMLARVGYAKPVEPAPRRDWNAMLKA